MHGQERIAMTCNACCQIANGYRSACDRRQESGQEKKPCNDGKKSNRANDPCRAGRRSDGVETLRDRAQGNRDSQKDKPEAWPSGRESRK
jgi:hypothetical protein